MPFERLETISKQTKPSLASVSYRRSKSKHGFGSPRLLIGIPKLIVGDTKWKKDQLFTVLLGSGADKGKARIAPSAAGGVAPRIVKGGYTFNFGFAPLLGEDAAEKEFVKARVVNVPKEGASIEIVLPAWFKG